MVKQPKAGKWLSEILEKINRFARDRRIIFTHKAALEVGSLELGLDFDDVCDVLMRLKKNDFHEHLISHVTRERLYVFKPEVGGTVSM